MTPLSPSAAKLAAEFGLNVTAPDDAPGDGVYTPARTLVLDCSAEPAAPGSRHGDVTPSGRIVIGNPPMGPRMTPAALREFAARFGMRVKE